MNEKTKNKVLELLNEVRETLLLSDPEGDRVEAFGDDVAEDAEVKRLCERVGYGAVMDSAARQWRMKDEHGGSHTVGACVLTVQNTLEELDEAIELVKAS